MLEAIHKSWTELNELIDDLSDDQMTQPGVVDDWSIKDLLIHMATWERVACDRLNAARTDEPLHYPVIREDEDLDDFIDNFNAETYQKHKDDPLDQVKEESQAAHQEMLNQIEALEEEYLAQKPPFDWEKSRTIQVLISANTHWHFDEHIQDVKNWLVTQPKTA